MDAYSKPPVSEEHNTLTGNLFAALHAHVRGTSCRVFMADMKTRVVTAAGERFYYPDLQVVCDPDDRERYFKSNPCLIVEVLSDSTERHDRADKFYAYRKLANLQEYVLIAQDECRVEIYRRRTDWELEIYTAGDVVLESVGLTLPLANLYERVRFLEG